MTTPSPDNRKAIWSIGIYCGHSPLDLRPAEGTHNPVLTRDNVSDVPACFVADPFLMKTQGAWHMLFEVMNGRTGRGEIGWATSADGLHWRYRQIVLREPYHLSYPYVFEWGGEYYMIPESHKARCVRLYRAEDFPTRWAPVTDLLQGPFADSSIFRYNDRWWLFTYESSSSSQADVLRLFSALELTGGWTEHPRSPILAEAPHTARPGGRVVVTGGRLIRFAQDCQPVYGGQVRAFEISRLSSNSYEEHELEASPLLGGSGVGWNQVGMHHVDAQQLGEGEWIACTDGFAWEQDERPLRERPSANPVTRLKGHLRQYTAYSIASEIKTVIARHYASRNMQPVISLKPNGTSRGQILFSYFTHAFTGQPLPYTHTAFWESRRMAEILAELGYAVDVISAAEAGSFYPEKEYEYFIGHRQNFDKLAGRLSSDCVKVLHCDVAHWLSHNTAGYQRALALQARKGFTLPVLRLQEPNFAIEHADCATVLGNEFTMNTYRYANKPMYRVPISAPATYPWPDAKDFDTCRRHFLWFNSNGFVHKGLDLVLETFASMPDFQLTVCGPVTDPVERPFERAYFEELYRAPNIHTAGWVEDGSEEFLRIANRCVAVISASSSEGGGGSVISCMHTGLIPLVSYESSVDTHSFGFVLPDCSIEGITRSVRLIAGLPAEDLRNRARAAWHFARANHTRDRFAQEFRNAASAILRAREDTAARKETQDEPRRDAATVTMGEFARSGEPLMHK